jgi:hypothetical protein
MTQKLIFSDSPLIQDLVSVLGANGLKAVTEAFNNSKTQEKVKGIFSNLINSDFIDITQFKAFSNKSPVAYQSLEKILSGIERYTKSSNTLGSEQNKKNKFEQALESVTFLETDMLYKLVSGNYDVASVKRFLQPSETKDALPESPAPRNNSVFREKDTSKK